MQRHNSMPVKLSHLAPRNSAEERRRDFVCASYSMIPRESRAQAASGRIFRSASCAAPVAVQQMPTSCQVSTLAEPMREPCRDVRCKVSVLSGLHESGVCLHIAQHGGAQASIDRAAHHTFCRAFDEATKLRSKSVCFSWCPESVEWSLTWAAAVLLGFALSLDDPATAGTTKAVSISEVFD